MNEYITILGLKQGRYSLNDISFIEYGNGEIYISFKNGKTRNFKCGHFKVSQEDCLAEYNRIVGLLDQITI